ncbi:MAG TPA: A/G-specific adenine glycosylase [Pirellulales bacterium]|jgi:A/G-specific adenine glycosylase
MKKSRRQPLEAQLWPSQWRQAARRRLLVWFRRNARDLAWRKTRDPYAIWVSEIMLQQTQVATVERYYPSFLAAFPSIVALAAADEQQVLRNWEGLGYYRRARQIHAAAKKMTAEHGGAFPRDIELVRQLPGIGRYTAGAILSIAFDSRQPILEANTIRLLSRLLAYRGDTASAAGQTILWHAAESLLGKSGHGELNQALMEIGSLVCTPRNPQCEVCPLESLCPTRQAGLQNVIPRLRLQPKIVDVREAAVIVHRRGKVLLRKCADGERWAGLWDFPRFPLATTGNHKSNAAQQIIANTRQLVGVAIVRPMHFTTLRHTVTRFRITLDCYHAESNNSPAGRSSAKDAKNQLELCWVNPNDLGRYPLCVTGRKLAKFAAAASKR